jgi:hypothetical protein
VGWKRYAIWSIHEIELNSAHAEELWAMRLQPFVEVAISWKNPPSGGDAPFAGSRHTTRRLRRAVIISTGEVSQIIS